MKQTRKRLLSRLMILDEALKFTRTDGLDKLTLKQLAGKLNVSEPALYYHYKDREAIVLAVINAIVGEILRAVPSSSESWQEAIWDISDAYSDALIAYPNTASYLSRYSSALPNTALGFEHVSNVLGQAGFSLSQQVFAVHTIFNHISTTIQLNEIYLFDKTAHRRSKTDWDRLVPKSMQHFEETAFSLSVKGRLDTGLQIILQGLECELERSLGHPVDRRAADFKIRD